MTTTEVPDRRYALIKIAAGDYLCPSNDGSRLWRFSRYTDGPSFGLEGWPRDRLVWMARSRPMPLDEMFGLLDEDWLEGDWTVHADWLDTRADAINAMLRRS